MCGPISGDARRHGMDTCGLGLSVLRSPRSPPSFAGDQDLRLGVLNLGRIQVVEGIEKTAKVVV
ncbi:MAG: hypothetical protein ABJD57_04410 [Roseibium sp.]|uniref:hypothetical protein n=1 Tax=Roseibium sp. TaxID=1936156 RepID=UPI003266DE37